MRALAVPLLTACALAWGVALALGAFASPREPAGGTLVVATTTQVADFVREVGGSRVRVRELLAANADPHEHEVTPGDVSALGGARLVVRSGLEVDGWLLDARSAARSTAPLVDLSRSVRLHRADPHWWQDPRNALRAVRTVSAALTRADPGGARGYAARARAYERRLRAADGAIAACWSRVPRAQRRLV